MAKQRAEVDHDALLAVVRGAVVRRGLLDDPVAGADPTRMAGLDLLDDARMLVRRAPPDRHGARLHVVGEDAGVDVGDLGPLVEVGNRLEGKAVHPVAGDDGSPPVKLEIGWKQPKS